MAPRIAAALLLVSWGEIGSRAAGAPAIRAQYVVSGHGDDTGYRRYGYLLMRKPPSSAVLDLVLASLGRDVLPPASPPIEQQFSAVLYLLVRQEPAGKAAGATLVNA